MNDRSMGTAAPLSMRRRLWLWAELAGIYILAPIGIAAAIFWLRQPLFVVLLPVLALFVLLLLADRSFRVVDMLRVGIRGRDLAGILALLVPLGAALIALGYLWVPDRFLAFPKYRPGLWALVMVLYPVISVTTQELIYRVFFFHRYGALLGGPGWPAIMASAALFAFGHIIFANWPSIVISFFGGLIFAWRYARTGSFWTVSLEHGIYGDLIFTVGLGMWFFTGVSMRL